MNHIYAVLWNQALGCFCVTSELGRSRSRSTCVRKGSGVAGVTALPALTILAAALALPVQAALPENYKLVAGIGTVTTADSQMTITQKESKLILDWQSFNIGKNQSVIFNQPNKEAVALNRVVGREKSDIHGLLKANGQVFLVNPNGVLFSKGAQVSVAGLVASTLNIPNEDFLRGKYAFQGHDADLQAGEVVNRGVISAHDGGFVALLGGKVSNQGRIAAFKGAVALAAGNEVSLDFAGDGLIKVHVNASALNALVENCHLIEADGGSVVLTAHATNALLQTVINNTGRIQARTVESREGKIELLGGFNGGSVKIAGTLDASAAKAGNGGFVDTSGAHVQISQRTRVTTQATRGKTGSWLIDPTDLTISAGNAPQTTSGIGAKTLATNLKNTSITLQTLATGAEKGDIHVNAPVAWGQNTLTLNAHGSINVNAVMTANASAGLEMNYGGYSASNPNAAKDTGVHMALTAKGFTGRVDFKGVVNPNQPANPRLKINGQAYTLLTQLGSAGSTTGLDLQGMAGNLAGYYALGADIDARATAGWACGFKPVGDDPSNPFTGTFEGLGHAVRKLSIDRPNEDLVGLFGTAINATLRNVGLVEGSVKGKNNVGGLVGTNAGIQGTASISHAYATGKVEGQNSVGGLVGENTGMSQGTASIFHAYAKGKVQGQNAVGGLVGWNLADQGIVNISYSYAAGAVTGKILVGGLAGQIKVDNGTTSIAHAYATGKVQGEKNVGGLVGTTFGINQSTTNIAHAYATGTVKGEEYVGGLVGWNFGDSQSTASIAHAYATGTVKGEKYVGGLVGENQGGEGTASIAHAYAKGTVLGEEYVGGLVGRNFGEFAGTASIAHAYAAGEVQGEKYIGGLVGMNFGNYQSTASIAHAYAKGTVKGEKYVGGLVGENQECAGTASIAHAYATGDVQGKEFVGGLVGWNSGIDKGTASISHVYASGEVQGPENVGGLLGANSGNISHAYFDLDSTGQAYVIGVGVRGVKITAIESINRYQHGSYTALGDWTETANGSGIWQAKDAQGVVQWIQFEGSSRPFLASEYSTTIGNAHQLQLMAYKPDASYQLASDIDASATRVDAGNAKQHGGMWSSSGFVPVGDSAAKFTGSLNGQGHTISGLNIDRPKQHNVGLFGYAENAQLRHLGVEGSVKGIDHVALLVGKNVADRKGAASIFDVMVSGQVTGFGNSVGGLVGSNRAKKGSSNQIDHVYAEAKVNAGTLHDGVVLNGVGVGGLVGKNYAKDGSIVSINNAVAWTWTTGGSNVGGLVGIQHAQNGSLARIDHAEVDAQMAGAANIGALIGTNIEANNSTATFENCFGQALTDKHGTVESVKPVGFNTSAP